MISQETEKVKHKKQELQSFVDSLEKKVEKYYDKAEKDHCIESMTKGNPFWNTVKEKKETNVWPCFISWRPRKRQKFSLRALWIMFAIIELVGFSSDCSDWFWGSYFSAYCASKWHTSQ